MNRDAQRHLAEILCDYRERLERARNELDPRLDESGFPLDSIAGEMLLVEVRMLDIENFMRDDIERRERRERRHPLKRLRELMRPRIGLLYQHKPALLMVPTSYYATNAPSPAPTISVVTPSYGQGNFIERTLYSVVSQHYPALEYVVQDGGSRDETVEILRRYEGSLHHWASEPDDGQADAINRGFAHTSGEIMAYLNSDDVFLPGSLAYVARYFSEHPDVDVIYGHRMIVDEEDHHIGSWLLPRHDSDELTLVDFVPQETLFWRRSAWEAAGGEIDASMNFALDWDLLLRMRESGAKMVRVPRFLGAFRAHEAQKTQTLEDEYLTETAALRARVHGRGMSHDEAFARASPYTRRHVPYHLWYRLRARLPGRRQVVRVLPVEPWLRAPRDLEASDAQLANSERGAA
ncbi:MAG TPA: glycosyltransferase family 2 protein [Solirubrobacteraceae bacterium]|jgi:glycosyltransferase involved in cell wall biosynthesis